MKPRRASTAKREVKILLKRGRGGPTQVRGETEPQEKREEKAREDICAQAKRAAWVERSGIRAPCRGLLRTTRVTAGHLK